MVFVFFLNSKVLLQFSCISDIHRYCSIWQRVSFFYQPMQYNAAEVVQSKTSLYYKVCQCHVAFLAELGYLTINSTWIEFWIESLTGRLWVCVSRWIGSQTKGHIKKYFCKDLSQIVLGSKWTYFFAKSFQKMPKRAKIRLRLRLKAES